MPYNSVIPSFWCDSLYVFFSNKKFLNNINKMHDQNLYNLFTATQIHGEFLSLFLYSTFIVGKVMNSWIGH